MKKNSTVQHTTLYRRLMLTLFILLIFFLQYSFSFPFGISIPLVAFIPTLVGIAAFEYEFPALFFGAFCGVLFDVASPVADGIITLFFTLASCATGLVFHYIMRNTLHGAFIVNAVFAAVFTVIYTLFNCVVKDASFIRDVILYRSLPTFILTALSLPVFYYPVRYIEKKFRNKVRSQ